MAETSKAYRFALDPTDAQAEKLRQHCGAARFVYNHMLGLANEEYAAYVKAQEEGVDFVWTFGKSHRQIRNHWNSIKDEVAPWWREVSKEAFAGGCANLASAFKNLFDSLGRYPRFKTRAGSMSCTFTTGAMRVNADRRSVTLPRIGRIHTHESTKRLNRKIDKGTTRITQATIKFERGRWFVSFLVRETFEFHTHHRAGSVVGVDMGVKDLVVAATPDGTEVMRVPVPQRLKDLENRRRKLQRANKRRRAPRKGVIPSKRWERGQKRIRAVDARMANIREDLLHKVSTTLTRSFENVVVEDLNVRGMMTRAGAHKRGLNRAVARASMSSLRAKIEYKAGWGGGAVTVVPRFYPSSKTCSGCGVVKAKLLLSERVFSCEDCGLRIDRDLNAAVNLARKAGSGPVLGRGGNARPAQASACGANPSETSTPTGDLSCANAGCV